MKKALLVDVLILFCVLLMTPNGFCEKAQSTKPDNVELESTDCYTTQHINSSAFIDKKDTIKNVKIKCRKGYFMTGLTQSAEKDPVNFGQYIIVSDIECCRPYLSEKTKQ